MSEWDPELFEKELAKLKPAKPPEGFMRRMAEEATIAPSQSSSRPASPISWWTWLRWAVPATAALAILIAWLGRQPGQAVPDRAASAPRLAQPPIKADNIEIDQRLVATFDAIGQLPDGEPVHLRCREWVDGVTLRDSARGVVIERQAPRFEIVPVRFETY